MYTFTAEAVKPLYCDFETQSPVDLKKQGAYNYIRSPFTRIMSGVFFDGETIHIWIPAYTKFRMTIDDLFAFIQTKKEYADLLPYDYILYNDNTLPKPIAELCRTHTLIAHNAEMFDAWLFDEKCPGLNTTWFDTIHGCRYAGIPAGLDGALKSIGESGKGDNASMLLLSKAKIGPKGAIIYSPGTVPIQVDLILYNIYDTVKLKKLSDWLQDGNFTKENNIIETHGLINQNGFYIDREYTKRLRDIWHELQNHSKDVIEEITHGGLKYNKETDTHDISSPQKVKAWLLSKGFTLPIDERTKKPTLNRAMIEKILNRPDDYIGGLGDETAESVIALLAERRNAVRSVVGKLNRILEESDETGLVRNWCVLHGAGPGRFSGRGIQPHNFPRGVKLTKGMNLTGLIRRGYDLTYADILQAAADNSTEKVQVIPADVLATMTRATIIPDTGNRFSIFDYSSIEARGVAWVFNCTQLLNGFFRNADVYCEMASCVVGRLITPIDETERFIGKQIVLGCGYQMGHKKFALMCEMYGINLQAANVTAKQCVDAYRKTYPEIPNGWNLLNIACIRAIKFPGESFSVARCELYSDGNFFNIVLPSGRRLRYRNPRIVMGVLPWNTSELVEQAEYQHHFGYYKKLYGGILAENIVQAIARDLLCHALCSLHSVLPVLHVHDEIVGEYAATLDSGTILHAMGREMTTPPDWAKDFPLAAEGFTGDVYTKGKLFGEKSVAYLAANQIAV